MDINIRKTMKLDKELKNSIRKKTTAETPAAKKTTSTGNGQGAKAVTIEAKIDVGFGNALYLRGEGRGLSWNQGIPLTCVDNSTWKWTGESADKMKFKLLLNDQVWAAGEDLVAAPGEKVRISPVF